MVWLALVLIASILFALFWRFVPAGRRHWPVIAFAVGLGLAGYGWQGNALLPASPARPSQDVAAQSPAPVMAPPAAFSSEGEYLGYADAMLRIGQSEKAVTLLTGGVEKHPQNADLWVALANALIVHGKGTVSPAARFAIRKAGSLSPGNFSVLFLTGLDLAQQEKLEDARTIWAAMLARSPADAPWRADLEQRVKAIDEVLSPQLQQP